MLNSCTVWLMEYKNILPEFWLTQIYQNGLINSQTNMDVIEEIRKDRAYLELSRQLESDKYFTKKHGKNFFTKSRAHYLEYLSTEE